MKQQWKRKYTSIHSASRYIFKHTDYKFPLASEKNFNMNFRKCCSYLLKYIQNNWCSLPREIFMSMCIRYLATSDHVYMVRIRLQTPLLSAFQIAQCDVLCPGHAAPPGGPVPGVHSATAGSGRKHLRGPLEPQVGSVGCGTLVPQVLTAPSLGQWFLCSSFASCWSSARASVTEK